jgi:phosphoribosylformylglycinamidine synthase
MNRLLQQPELAQQYQIMCLPGGFSYGDDIAAGRIAADQMRHHLFDAMQEFREQGKLILGICNGFQILLKSGILLADDTIDGPQATLAWNDTGRFEDRWVHLSVEGELSVFLRDVNSIYLPIAHAEGKFVARSKTILHQLDRSGQLALRYTNPELYGQAATDRLPFPFNPNGSQANVAGVCDATGRVLGLMPHPERHIDPTHHPQWTRGVGDGHVNGLRLFENAVAYFA